MSYLIETSIPPLHRDWDISQMMGADNLDEVKQNVVQYINDPDIIRNGNNLYLYSVENGTGKTRVANFIVGKLNQPRLDEDGNVIILPIAIVSFGEYLKFCNTNEKARETIMTRPILLLDDVSPAFGSLDTQGERRELLLLMKYRREHMLVTIITSNLTPEAFQKRYGTTALSKVLENFSYIEVRGGDVRPAIYPDQFEEGKDA